MDSGTDAARRKWSLSREAFDGLLASLGSDRDSAGLRYLEIRRNLVRLFEWRGCATPDEYADETLNRCAKRIADGEAIQNVGTYAVGVARMLLREQARERTQRAKPLDAVPEPHVLPAESDVELERRTECLRQCLGHLAAMDRDIILGYYHGEKGEKINNRKQLTRQFGIPAGTLRMRALRLREKLQSCAENCLRISPGKLI
jgi:RNA polymerase sigma factor (sigma-70 family)